MANIGSVTSYFANAQEGFTTTFAASAAPGVGTVTLTALSAYSTGDVVVLIAEPTSATNKQVFTGTVTPNGVLTNVQWLTGANVIHNAGTTVVDYPTASGFDMLSKGVQQSLNQNGTLKQSAVQTAIGTGGINSGNIANGSITFTDLLTTIFSSQVQTIANTGSAAGTLYYINLGGIKILWGQSANTFLNNTSGPNSSFTFPTNFFTTTQFAVANFNSINTVSDQKVNVTNLTPAGAIVVAHAAASTTGEIVGLLVIGT